MDSSGKWIKTIILGKSSRNLPHLTISYPCQPQHYFEVPERPEPSPPCLWSNVQALSPAMSWLCIDISNVANLPCLPSPSHQHVYSWYTMFTIPSHGWLMTLFCPHHMEVSWNRGTPSDHPFIARMFPIINQPLRGIPNYGTLHIDVSSITGINYKLVHLYSLEWTMIKHD